MGFTMRDESRTSRFPARERKTHGLGKYCRGPVRTPRKIRKEAQKVPKVFIYPRGLLTRNRVQNVCTLIDQALGAIGCPRRGSGPPYEFKHKHYARRHMREVPWTMCSWRVSRVVFSFFSGAVETREPRPWKLSWNWRCTWRAR